MKISQGIFRHAPNLFIFHSISALATFKLSFLPCTPDNRSKQVSEGLKSPQTTATHATPHPWPLVACIVGSSSLHNLSLCWLFVIFLLITMFSSLLYFFFFFLSRLMTAIPLQQSSEGLLLSKLACRWIVASACELHEAEFTFLICVGRHEAKFTFLIHVGRQKAKFTYLFIRVGRWW